MTIPVIAREVGVSERATRRAMRELELLGLIACARNSQRKKIFCQICEPKRPKTASQNGPKRPKTASDSFKLSNSNNLSADDCLLRTDTSKQQPHRQISLDLRSDQRMHEETTAAVQLLEEAVREQWDRAGRKPAFLLWDSSTIAGFALALQRFDLCEIADCVTWSARECLAGRLKPGMFATTFRGGAFADRWRRFKAHEDRLARKRSAQAEIQNHEPVDHIDAERIGSMAQSFLASKR